MIPHAYLLPSRHLRSRRHTSRRRRSPYLVEGLRARSPFSPLPFPLSTPFPAIRDGLAWKADQPVGRRLLHPRATRSIRDSLFSLYLSRFRSCSPSLSIILYLILSLSLSFLSRSRFIHDAQPNGSVVVSSSQQQPATGRSALDWLFVSKRSFCCYAGSPLAPLLSPPLARTLSLFLFLSFTPVPPLSPHSLVLLPYPWFAGENAPSWSCRIAPGAFCCSSVTLGAARDLSSPYGFLLLASSRTCLPEIVSVSRPAFLILSTILFLFFGSSRANILVFSTRRDFPFVLVAG